MKEKSLYLIVLAVAFFSCTRNREGAYDDSGRQHGEWTTYHDNGAIKSRGAFINGKRDGRWEFFYDNGMLKKVGSFSLNNKDGAWSHFSRNGKFTAFEQYTLGRKDGLVILISENDASFSIESYKNERADGVSLSVDENGKLREFTHWANGSQHGSKATFDKGCILEYDDFMNGTHQGYSLYLPRQRPSSYLAIHHYDSGQHRFVRPFR